MKGKEKERTQGYKTRPWLHIDLGYYKDAHKWNESMKKRKGKTRKTPRNLTNLTNIGTK